MSSDLFKVQFDARDGCIFGDALVPLFVAPNIRCAGEHAKDLASQTRHHIPVPNRGLLSLKHISASPSQHSFHSLTKRRFSLSSQNYTFLVPSSAIVIMTVAGPMY